ncbi:MAG TPA: PAS domain S-box protein, partial [Puia sp.]|nr:PAS domain S-box protein [Puia sp.]
MKIPFVHLPALPNIYFFLFRRGVAPRQENYRYTKAEAARYSTRGSEEKYRILIEEASDAIVISDVDGDILETNDSAAEMLGFDKDQLVGMNIRELYLNTELKDRPFQYKELFEKKVVRTERIIVCRDGSEVPVEVMVKRISDGRFMAIIRDITERRKVENELKAAIEKYDILAKATSDTIWDWDLHRNTKVYNGGIRTVFGYDVHEVGNADGWIMDKLHPEDLEYVREAFLHAISNKKQNLQLEYRFRCSDGSYKYVYDRSFVIYGSDHKPARIIGAMQDITLSREEDKRIATAIIDAQEKERLHLGRELHDNVNQILACAHLTLEAARDYIADTDKTGELIACTKGTIELAIEEIRKLSHHLAPAAIEEACLKNIIEQLLGQINIQKKYSIEFEFDDQLLQLRDDRIIVNLYRIIQEQLKNIVKYADASRISVVLLIRDELIHLRIEDNGRGFDPRVAGKGIGLNNIRKRIESLSGKFILRSAPGNGCVIMAELP